VVLAAGDSRNPDSARALEELCRAYWYPLYAYLRRRGHVAADAQDLVQAFLLSLLERKSLRQVGPAKGKFRSFLLAALNHFLADEWDKARAQKRGGGEGVISIDAQLADSRYQALPADQLSPDKLYDRQWAMTLLDQAFNRLREENADHAEQWETLYPFLIEVPHVDAYEQAAARLKMNVAAVRMAVHRLRQHYHELVRAEIAKTTTSPLDVDAEWAALVHAIQGT
jgi:RNA polymerase sigma-70 factor (ECF subfamily)